MTDIMERMMKTKEALEHPDALTSQQNSNEEMKFDHEVQEIGIYVWIDRVTDINIVNQTFDAAFDLVLTWEGTKSDVEHYKTTKNDFVPQWTPDFKIKNGKCEQTIVRCKVLSENGTNTDYYGGTIDWEHVPYPILIEHVSRVEGTFHETFELENFPLDCQDIQINFELKDPLTKCIFRPMSPKKVVGDIVDSSGILLQNSTISGYKPGHRMFFEFYCTDYGGDDSNTYSIANLKFKLRREFTPYFWRIGLILMVTSGYSVLAFALDNSLSDRLGLLFTLLLTIVAFQFVAASYVPNLHYLTYLDYYVAMTFLFVCAVIVVIAVIDIFDINDNDVYFGIVSCIIYVLIHIIFVVKGYKARKYEVKKLEMDRFDYYNNGYVSSEDFSVSCVAIDGINNGENDVVIDKKHKDMLNKDCYSFLPEPKSKKD